MKTRIFQRAEKNRNANALKLKTVSLMVAGLFAVPAEAAVLTPPQDVAEYPYNGWKDKNSYEVKEGVEVFDGIEADITPTISGSQFFINIEGRGRIRIDGDTRISSVSDGHEDSKDTGDGDPGTYVFRVSGEDSLLELNGNVNVVTEHDLDPEKQKETIGANLFYADNGGKIEVGHEGGNTLAWAVAGKPDVVSAKNGGVVNIRSTNNKIVGNIDFLDRNNLVVSGTKVEANFVGDESYWYGDDQSFENFYVQVDDQFLDSVKTMCDALKWLPNNPELSEAISLLETFPSSAMFNDYMSIFNKLLSLDKTGLIEDKLRTFLKNNNVNADAYIQSIKNFKQPDQDSMPLDLTFSDGAQWTYFGQIEKVPMSVLNGAVIQKRISSITLNGGIVNLFDKDIEDAWQRIGLKDTLIGDNLILHDYVRIGNLKGNGGIFRLDLDVDNKNNSDMIYIESTSETEKRVHYIEPYNLQNLENISKDNTLTFAWTGKDAANITFADKMNFYGETLYDYELQINSAEITTEEQAKQFAESEYNKTDLSFGKEKASQVLDQFDLLNSRYWFVERVTLSESASTVGMRSAGYASYDAAIQLDRHDRRLREAVFADDRSHSGLWVRYQHGQLGAKGSYTSDVNTVYVGAEGALTDSLRLGASFSFMDGDADFNDVNGSSDMERYEAALYGTYENGGHYVDIVARMGHVSNEFSLNNALGNRPTSGSFGQNYAAVSAEYGYKFDAPAGIFIEPQLQVQGAYLGGYDYRVQRGMRMEVEQDSSLIGRIGLRLGKTIRSQASAGEIYVRADMLHQFTDGQHAELSDNDAHRLGLVWGDADTWANYGVGGYFNWTDRLSIQLDVEKSSGSNVADTWFVSGRATYLF